jgi:hypothetical protein
MIAVRHAFVCACNPAAACATRFRPGNDAQHLGIVLADFGDRDGDRLLVHIESNVGQSGRRLGGCLRAERREPRGKVILRAEDWFRWLSSRSNGPLAILRQDPRPQAKPNTRQPAATFSSAMDRVPVSRCAAPFILYV